jgi:hypothetical protein
MGKNGGPRPGAGRKPKIQEIKIIEQMDAICVPDKIWEALLIKCAQGDTNAIKLWLSYRFGLPKQQIDVTSNGEKIAPPIQWIGRHVAIEAAKIVSEEEEEEAEQLDELQIKVRNDYQALLDNQDNQDNQDTTYIL